MTDSTRTSDGRFGPGNSGRPPGARNRMSKRVALGILSHFEANQEEVLARLSRWWLPEYVRMVGRLLPRVPDEDGPDPEGLDDEDAAALAAAAHAALDRVAADPRLIEDLQSAFAAPRGGARETVIYGENTEPTATDTAPDEPPAGAARFAVAVEPPEPDDPPEPRGTPDRRPGRRQPWLVPRP